MKTCFLSLLVFGVAVLLTSNAVQAGVYVVAPGGSDGNPGTAARPLATLQKAADLARAGDTVLVKSGLYREAVHLHQSGTALAPIRFEANPPGSVVVTGAEVVMGWTHLPGNAPIYSIPWDHLFEIDRRDGKPIEAHPEDAPLWGRAEQVIADRHQLLPALTLTDLTTAWEARAKTPGKPVASPLPHLGGPFVGMFAVDTSRKMLYAWLCDGSDPKGHQMEAATHSQIFGVNQWESQAGVSYVQVRGFVFRYGASFPQRGAVTLHGSHNLMENCLIEQMAGSGVSVAGTMTGCLVRGCGHTGGAAIGDGFVNRQCLWEGNCWKPIDRDWDAGGVKMAFINGGLFQECAFRRNGGPGLWFDIDMRNVRVTQCVFQENEGTGLMIEISRRNRVDHCLAVGNGTGVVGKATGWAVGGILLAESEDCIVTQNTCIGNRDGVTFREQGPRPLETPDGTIDYHNTRNTVAHNLCVDNQGYQIGLWYDNGFFGRHPGDTGKYPTEEAYSAYLRTIPDKVYDPTKQGLVIDYNLYRPAPGKPVVIYGVDWRPRHWEFAAPPDFTRATGFDAHSRIVKDIRPVPGAGWADAPANVNAWIMRRLPKWLTAAHQNTR